MTIGISYVQDALKDPQGRQMVAEQIHQMGKDELRRALLELTIEAVDMAAKIEDLEFELEAAGETDI